MVFPKNELHDSQTESLRIIIELLVLINRIEKMCPLFLDFYSLHRMQHFSCIKFTKLGFYEIENEKAH